MVAIVGRPNVVVRVDTQTMWVREEAVTNTLNEITLSVIFGEHGLGALKQEYVSLRIYCHRRSFAGGHSFGEFEEVGHDPIRKFGNRLERDGFPRGWLRAGMKRQEGNASKGDS